MSHHSNHNMPPCGRPPQHLLIFGELNYTAEQINALLGMIPFKADRAEVPKMEKLSDVNYLGHVADATLLPEQEQPAWALVGNIEAARPYFYYVEDFVPKGYQQGWNDISQDLGTYDLTALNEVYHTKLLSRFGSYEQIDGAAVTEQDIQEIARIIKAVQNNKTVSFFYEPDEVTFNYFGTLDCYYNSSKTEFGCYLPTSDGYVIARCNISKPDKWALVLSSCDNEVSNSKNYNSLKGRPAINGVTLSGNHKPSELDLATLTEFNTLKKDVTEVSSDAQQKAEYAVETSDEARNISVSAESKSDFAVATSNEAKRISEIARNAVTTLEGLANATTADQTLAGQVVQIEENKQNIASNKADADAKLSELGQETDILSAINGTKAEKIIPTILTENTAIRWNDNAIWSYEGFNRTQSITLNKGEAVLIKARVFDTMAALYRTSQNVGYGDITSLVQGKDDGVQSYAYRATEDKTYIGATYRVAEGIEVYRLTSEEYEQLQASIEKNINGITGIKELHEIAPLPLSIGVGTGNNGKPFESSVRATTGVIKNERPLVIYVPKGYKVQYRSGNSETDLPNASYIKENYDEDVLALDVEESYITFNLVAENDIAENTIINLIIAQDNTAIARLIRKYMENTDSLNALKNQTMPSISENLLNPYECEDNKELVDGTGKTSNNETRWVTGYIAVNHSICPQILISHIYCHRLAQYDENKNFITMLSANISPLTLNESTRYIRISYFKSGKEGGINIPFENRFDVRVYYNLGYDVDDNHNILDKVNVKDSQYVDMQTIYPFLSDKDNKAATSSFELLVFRGNQARKNQIFSSCAKYVGDGYATIQFKYNYIGAEKYTSPKYIIGGKGIYERKEWRVPPFLERVSELNVYFTIPDGGKLYFADFYNEYSNAISPNIKNGIQMNAHTGFGYAPSNTQGAFAMCAKLGYPQIVTMPKLTSDGVWVCFHDDSNIGNSLCNEDGTNLDSETATKAISEITFEQLSGMIYKRGGSSAYQPPYKVPTLESFFDLCKKTGVCPMYSIHPLWSTLDCQNNYNFCKKHRILHLLTPKMPISENYFDYFRLLYNVFGNDVKAYALNIDAENLDTIIPLIKEMGIQVPITIELMADGVTEEAVKKIVDNGFRASVAPYTGIEITGEMLKTWIKWGVTEFTEDHNCSFGLNW